MDNPERVRDRKKMLYQAVVSGFLVLAGGYLINVSRDLPGPSLPGAIGPREFPIAALSALVIASLWFLGTGLARLARDRREGAAAEGSSRPTGQSARPEWGTVFGVLASLFAYAWIWHRAGFLATSFLFVTTVSALLAPPGKRSWLRSILLGLVVTGAIYALFYGLLKLPMPYWDWR